MNYLNYIAKVTCFNCRKQMRIKIRRGRKVISHCCPKCGNADLVAGYVMWS